ncbi:ribosome recycling factor [hydrocarbon metagenome]|uniref:Ribosome recycling factor n=1 Tax=hydrocarbon metagenome TaxID=938273 RepID=A0A0W8E4N6_9ZZZZ
MIKDILHDAEEKMQKSIEFLAKDLSTLRAGRANPAMVEKITVEYYGETTPINQLGNITVPEARLLVIQPWDKSIIPDIEKAIFRSDLGITPSNDGVVIRIAVPQLTEERRKDLVKVVKKKGEEAKVAIRNIRRESNDLLKMSEKEKLISEDENKKGMDEIQKFTDKYVKNVDLVLQAKEKDIMEV